MKIVSNLAQVSPQGVFTRGGLRVWIYSAYVGAH